MSRIRRTAGRAKRKAVAAADDAAWQRAIVVGDPAAARRLLEADPGWAPPLKVRVTDTSVLRMLTLPTEHVIRTRDLHLRIDDWEAPLEHWRGRARPIRSLAALSLEYHPQHRRAEAQVRLLAPVALRDLIAALLPAFTPGYQVSGAGFPLVAVDDSAPDNVLATIPTRAARSLRPFPKALSGVGLQGADLLIVGADLGDAERHATERLELSDDGRYVSSSPRTSRAIIDLQVHNPIGRLQSFQPSPPPHALALDGVGGAVVEPLDHAQASVPRVRFALAQPVPASAVRSLRNVESVSLESLTGPIDERTAARLVEIAATGVIAHSLPASAVVPSTVDESIVELLRRPYAQTKGLAREQRSVALRRAAMHHHAGFLDLAGATADRFGHRLLPRVSVILSSMRPDRIPGVLRLMAQQTYPHFEVVVVMHGVEAPDLTASSDELAGLDYRVVPVDSSHLFGAALAEGVRQSTGDLITKLDDDDWYSEHHVWDLVLAYLYSGADLVGKTTEYLYFEGIDHSVHRTFAVERYHEQAAGGAMMLSRATFDSLGGWRPTPNSTDRSVLIGLADAGGIAYRTHGLGYMYIRHSDSHTWVRTESQLLNGSFEQWRGMRIPETD